MGRSSRMSKKRQDNLWNKAKNNPDIKRLIDKRLNNRMPIKEYEVTLHHKSVESYRTTISASSKKEAEEIFSFLILGDDFYKDTYLDWHVEADIVEVSDGDVLENLLKAIGCKQSEILKIKGENKMTSQKIKIEGPDLDMTNVSKLYKQVTNLFKNKIKKITIDLERVNYIDSEGLYLLYDIHLKANKIGSKVQLINISAIRQILKTTGLLNRLNILELSHSL